MKAAFRRRPLLLLAVAAFLLRLGFFIYWTRLHGSYAVTPDDDYWARALARVHGDHLSLFEDLFRPPLYTWFLAAIIEVFGPHPVVAQVLQCAVAAAGTWLLAATGEALGDGTAGLIGAAFWTVNVYSIYYSAHFMTETLYTTLVMAFFLLWLKAERKSSLVLACATGLTGGAICLCRWTFFGFLPWFAVSEAWPKRMKQRWISVAACLGAAGLVIGIWGLRNLHLYGRFILAGPQKGWNFYEGLALQTSEDDDRPRQMGEEAHRVGVDKDVFAADRYFWEKGWRELREDPASAALLLSGKALKFWRLAPYPPHPRVVRWIAAVFYWILFSLALFGALAAMRQGIRLLPFHLFILFTWMVHTVFFSGIRYRFPLDPIFSLYAGFAVTELIRQRHVFARDSHA